MRKSYFSAAALAAAAVTVALVFTPGCEPAEGNRIVVTPAYAELRTSNPEVRLTASGWNEYEWELSNYTIGRLSATTGESVIYSTNGEITDATQVVTVKGRNSGATTTTGGGGSGTNANNSASGSIKNGTARIIHIAKKDEVPGTGGGGGPAEPEFAITPSRAITPSVRSAILTATPGWNNYVWWLSNDENGYCLKASSLPADNVYFVEYFSTNAGPQIVSVQATRGSGASMISRNATINVGR